MVRGRSWGSEEDSCFGGLFVFEVVFGGEKMNS